MPVVCGWCAGFPSVLRQIGETVSACAHVGVTPSLLGCRVLLSVLNADAQSVTPHPELTPPLAKLGPLCTFSLAPQTAQINPILEMKQPRLRRLSNLFPVAQLLGGPAQGEAAARLCLPTEAP